MLLNAGNFGNGGVERGRHQAMHLRRVVALNEIRRIPVAAQQGIEFIVRNACQHRRTGDLVAVQVQDGQHRAVMYRIEKFVRVPAGGQRAGFRFAVADDACDQQAGVVEGCAEGM